MKRLLIVMAVAVLLCQNAVSQASGFGLGVILGEPTGISVKGWMSSQSAFDAAFAWSFRRDGFLHLHADYLWHFQDIVNTSQRVNPYIGIGARLAAKDGDAVAGARIPFGIVWVPSDSPVDIFLEIAPIVDLTPETEVNANGGLGIRFYFR